MKISSIRAHGGVAVRLLLVIGLAGAAAAVIVNQKGAARLKSENQALMAESQEAQRLTEENNTIPQLRQAGEEAEKLRREFADLPRLRNEVRQLRRQADELQKLRAENDRLISEQKTATAKGQATALSLPPDFIPRAVLGDAGLGTPEAAAQTIFWAMCQGNFERLAQCSLDAPPASRSPNAHPDADRQSLIDHMKSFAGFRIAERKDISDAQVVLELQSSANGEMMPMTLKRVGFEWKLEHW